MNVKWPSFLLVGLILLLLGFWVHQRVYCSQTPLVVIQSGTEKALDILHSSKAGQAPSLKARKGEILKIVDEYFNFHEMAKRALGRPWKEQPPEKQKEFVELFKQLLFNSYVDKVESYTGANERFAYDEEKIEGIMPSSKRGCSGTRTATFAWTTGLRFDGGTWKVYDVVVEGISLVNNYREQFSSILTNESFDSLLKRMRQKVAAQSS